MKMITASKNSWINYFQLLLLSLLPAALVSGPLLSEIIINTLSIFFLFEIIIYKKYTRFKNILFVLLSIFYLILIISLINSNIFSESALNVFSYIRFIIFAFAAAEILKKNDAFINFFYLSLSLTILFVVLDGYLQFFTGENLLGYPKYRPDRLSGFFNDDLILGSYLFRLLPLFLGLTLYLKNRMKYFFHINLVIIFATIILIFLSGERSSFILTLLFLVIIILQIDIKKRVLVAVSLLLVLFLSAVLYFNQTLADRYISQLQRHLFGNGDKILSYYSPMFNTAYKMFKDKPIFGFGPKSYRYYCSKEKYVSYYPYTRVKDNTIIQINLTWKDQRNIMIDKNFVNVGDKIKKGEKLFSYYYTANGNIQSKIETYYSDKEGRVKKIIKKNRYINGNVYAEIEPLVSPEKEILKINACSTHPHNTYVQLLAETGFFGFIYVFLFFVYISYLLIKNFIQIYFFNKRNLSDLEICLLANFFVILWPLTTSGNFLNNWLNIISYLPLGIYLYKKNLIKNHDNNK